MLFVLRVRPVYVSKGSGFSEKWKQVCAINLVGTEN